MLDGIMVGAIACVLTLAADKIFSMNMPWLFYVGLFAGNFVFHAFLKG